MNDQEYRVRRCNNCKRDLRETYKQWGEYWSYKRTLYCSKTCLNSKKLDMEPAPQFYEEPLRHT